MSAHEPAAAWAQVARERGLALDDASGGGPAAPRLRGFLEGYGVELRSSGGETAPLTSRGGYHARQPGEAPNAAFEARCIMLPPLSAGLVVRSNPASGPAGFERFDLGERADVKVGDARLDEALEIRGEAAHILPLFTPELRAMLHALLDDDYRLTLLDTGVSLTRSIQPVDAASLHDALARCVGATLHLDHARQARDVAAFRVAGDLGGGLALNAYPVWLARNHWATEVFVRFAAPLGLGLFVRPARWNDAAGALFAGQDLVLGDAAFDEPFVVQSWAGAAAVAGVLDAEVRREVLALRDRVGSVHVRDDGVAVRASYVLSRDDEVWALARALAPLALRLVANADRGR